MPFGYLIGHTEVETVRTAEYSARLLDLSSSSRRYRRAVARMERELIAADGYPAGSFSVARQLQLIDEKEWQELICSFDQIAPSGALLALTYIEGQRIYRKSDLTIIYALLNLRTARRIILLDVQFPAAPTWGEVMKRIYSTTVRR